MSLMLGTVSTVYDWARATETAMISRKNTAESLTVKALDPNQGKESHGYFQCWDKLKAFSAMVF